MGNDPRRRKQARRPGHDYGYKRLFSHPQTVGELLLGFFRDDWVGDLDLATLQRAAPSFVSDDLRERHGDMVWKARLGGEGRADLYLILELQSTSYHFMAVRLLTYASLLLEQVIRVERLKPGDPLPLVLAVVIHSGHAPWRAPLDLARLFVKKEGRRPRLPRWAYRLLDANRLEGNDESWLAAVFRIEACRAPEELPGLIERLAMLLPRGREPELWRSVNVWLRSALRRKLPGVTISWNLDLEEVAKMEESFVAWRNKIRREGRAEGRAEGMRTLLLQQMQKRFGPLPEGVRERIETISSTRTLGNLGQRILTADSLKDLRLGVRAR